MRLFQVVLVILPGILFAQKPQWNAKIDPRLWEYAKADTAVEFLVVMQQQADVSAADQIRKKEEKGRYVYETLSVFAEKTQRNLRDMLQNEGVEYQSFWITNMLWVKASRPLIEEIAQLPEVGRIEMNPVWHLSRVPDSVEDVTTPTDRSIPLPWGLTKINADDVWNLGYTGAGIVIGGQDTGYEWKHPALKNKYRGWDGSAVDHNYNWHDAIHGLIGGGSNSCGLNLLQPCDDNYHGTHTMGTMVGATSADSIFGVAPGATWIGCRNMEEGDGTPATYIKCFQWFLAPTNLANSSPDFSKAPHVINNSWGCPTSEGCNTGNYATMEGVVNNLRSAGIMIVVSAGNDGSNCATVNTPAAIYNSSYSVGATKDDDVIANFSSRGPVTVYTPLKKPDISAPGVAILSCVGYDNNPTSYSYANAQGTSMAGPHIAGVVALILSARPDLIGNVDAIENLINSTAVPRFSTAGCGGDNSTTRPNNVYGWGRVDVLAAVTTALPVELLSFSAKANGTEALLTWLTGAEIECAGFSIQRSADGISWETLGEVACKGANYPYSFIDPKPIKGVNYYRLEQTDISGSSFFSPIRVLSMSASGYSLRLASATNKAFFEIVGEHASDITWQLEVRAMDGRLLGTKSVGVKGWLEMPELPAGVYLVVLHNGDGLALASEKWLLSR